MVHPEVGLERGESVGVLGVLREAVLVQGAFEEKGHNLGAGDSRRKWWRRTKAQGQGQGRILYMGKQGPCEGR